MKKKLILSTLLCAAFGYLVYAMEGPSAAGPSSEPTPPATAPKMVTGPAKSLKEPAIRALVERINNMTKNITLANYGQTINELNTTIFDKMPPELTQKIKNAFVDKYTTTDLIRKTRKIFTYSPAPIFTMVESIASSPDSKKIVSGSTDGTVRIWDINTGQPIGAPLQGHTDTVTSVAISPDGNKIVSGSKDNTVRIWNLNGGALLHTLSGHTRSVTSVAISPDGKKIVSGSNDNTIRIWDLNSGQPIGQLQGYASIVTSVDISPDNTKIVSGDFDGTIRIWDLNSGQPIGQLQGYSILSPIVISPDGTKIVSGSYNDTIRIWDANTDLPIGQPLQGHAGPVTSIAISPDGKKIVSGSKDRTVRIWNLNTGQPIGLLRAGHNRYYDPHRGPNDAYNLVESVAISSDNRKIIVGSKEKIATWNIPTFEDLLRYQAIHNSIDEIDNITKNITINNYAQIITKLNTQIFDKLPQKLTQEVKDFFAKKFTFTSVFEATFEAILKKRAIQNSNLNIKSILISPYFSTVMDIIPSQYSHGTHWLRNDQEQDFTLIKMLPGFENELPNMHHKFWLSTGPNFIYIHPDRPNKALPEGLYYWLFSLDLQNKKDEDIVRKTPDGNDFRYRPSRKTLLPRFGAPKDEYIKME